jgi:hypothetical protein
MQDVCHEGVCRGTLVETDTDGDGYCDRVETAAGCNPNDAAEIPIQAATYAGTGKGNGEAIMTWAAPTSSKPSTLSEPSCAQTGVCGPIGFCTAGRTGNPCAVASDCDQPANMCRLVVNYGNVPNLSVLYARLNGVDLPAGSFTPATRACSRKVDIAIDPSRRFNKLRLKAQGTVGTPGVLRRDKDSFKYLNY